MLRLFISAWRHWGCVTRKILENAKKQFEEASELDGYEELTPQDQAKITLAWVDGEVADADIPDSARKPEAEEDAEKPKKAPAKKAAKKAVDEDGKDEEAEEAPKKRATTSKVRRAPDPSFCGIS